MFCFYALYKRRHQRTAHHLFSRLASSMKEFACRFTLFNFLTKRINKISIQKPTYWSRATARFVSSTNMEQQPTAHTDSTSQDSKPKSEPDPNTGDNHLHDANGDENKGSVATESVAETEAPGDADQLQAPSCTSPRKKTVRWRSALVTEPRFLPDSNGSDKDLFDGSNPYVSSSPAHPSLSFSLKGNYQFRCL